MRVFFSVRCKDISIPGKRKREYSIATRKKGRKCVISVLLFDLGLRVEVGSGSPLGKVPASCAIAP